MGMMTAMGIAETETTLEQQLSWHFRGNCYPPIPLFMIPVAVAAIDAYHDEDYYRPIELPDGVSFRDSKTVQACDAVDQLFLRAWLIEDDYEDEE